MRLILKFKLEHEKFTNQYRNFLTSYFKFALSKEYYDEFSKYYENPQTKNFTFTVFIKNLKHYNGLIISPNKEIIMTISSSDYKFIMLLYNSLLMNKNKKMNISPNNKIRLSQLSLTHLKEINNNEIKIKMLSPLLIRDRDIENNIDSYKTIKDDNFIKYLNDNLIYLAKSLNLNINKLEITPIKTKKVVVPIMQVRYDATIGTFKLKGDLETLNTLYKIGISSRRSYGFGMFEVIND